MHQLNRSKSTAAAVAALLLASVALAACGSSSSGSSSTTAAATANATASTGGAAIRGRFSAIRECLQKNGITLPKRTPGGQRPPGGGVLGGGGPHLPAGVTRAQYEAALKKCGGDFARRGFGGARFSSPAAKAALVKFTACMRQAGVNIPAPNTSGNGPIFNTKGINTATPQFKAATTKCMAVLRSILRPRPGFAPGGGATGANGTAPPTSSATATATATAG